MPVVTMHVLNKLSRGFTLIELIVVMGILGILATATIAVMDPLGQIHKSDDVKRKSDLATVQKALEQYYQDFGKYPAAASNEIVDFKTTQPMPWGTTWSPYLVVLPKDPTSNRSYVYVVRSDMQGYWLYASLERTSDPQLCNSGNPCASAVTNNVSNACGTACNYVVSSPNVVK